MARDELTEALSALANGRAQVYTLLSLGFRSPADELVAGLRNGAFRRELQRALRAAGAPLPVHDIRTLAGSRDRPPSSTLARALRLEHTSLFVGPHALPAPPYESVFREPTWGVMGETTLEVRHAYETMGFALQPEAGELPDHVAVELEFLACLAEEEAMAWSAADELTALHWLEEEHTFLERHLGQWLPTLTDRVIAATTSPFYRSLARIARVFVAHAQGQAAALVRALREAAGVREAGE